MTHGTHISVVVPVYNERENIGTCLRKLWAALKDEPHEILVCYDFDEDTTLVGIAEMPDRPPSVRLVKNTIGRGAANALRAGFQAATGDVVVTTMADLSDPPEVIARMAELMRREKLAVVAGSRYMRGGSQTGGPLLKRTLSHTAGVSLRWVAGIGTNDATSNFRAYSRSFLDVVKIESRGGFEIALELTVKAHLAGLGVGEVPSSWTDRTAGESRFRLWKWLPHYLKWWMRAAWQPLVVWALWLWMTIGAAAFVASYASPAPLWDDLELVPFTAPDVHWTAEELWALHNEHRVPLPRLVATSLLAATHDVRTPMYLEVGLLSALALALVLVARKVRGRSWWCDAVFPLVYLHVGNAENLLMAFQLALIVPTCLAGLAVLYVLRRGQRGLGAGGAAFVGACLVALPLCGGPGLMLVPGLGAGLVALLAWSARRPDARRRAAPWLALGLLATAAVCVAYLVGFERPPNAPTAQSVSEVVGASLRVLSLAWGVAGQEAWPWSTVLLLALVAAASATLVTTWKERPEERVRVGAIATAIVAVFGLVLAIGFGRGHAGHEAAFAMRYVTLPAGALTFALLALTLYARRVVAWGAGVLVLVGMVAANVFANGPRGEEYGVARLGLTTELREVVASGAGPAAFLDEFATRIYDSDRPRTNYLVASLARGGWPPFDTCDARLRERYGWTMFSLPPRAVESPSEPVVRKIDGRWRVLAVPAGTTLVFDLPQGTTRVVGSVGVPFALLQQGADPRARVTLDAAEGSSDARRTLYDRTFAPKGNAADQAGETFDLQLPADRPHVLRIRVEAPAGADASTAWAFFGDVTFS